MSLGTMHRHHTMGHLDRTTRAGLFYQVWPISVDTFYGNICMHGAWE
jgi:hypothetical protein